jgi:type VI secretion system protein ImpJ
LSQSGRVVWREGDLLAPQQFQQLQRSFEYLVAERFRLSQGFDWGLAKLVLDDAAIRNGSVRLISARGVLPPEGVPFRIDEEDPAPPARSVEGHLRAGEQSTLVHLGVAALNSDRAAVADEANGVMPVVADDERRPQPARYTARLVDLPDENTAGDRRKIAVARRNVQLLFADEMRSIGEYDAIPIAEIERVAEGGFRYKEDFVPPAVAIGSSRWLVERLTDLKTRLETRSNELAQKRRPSGAAMDFPDTETVAPLQLDAVNATLPVLTHLLSRRTMDSELCCTHPELAYVLLVELAGRLCAASPNRRPHGIPAYDHGALGRCFSELHALLVELINLGGRLRAIPIPLSPQDPFLIGQLTDPVLLASETKFYLGIRADMDPVRLRADVLALVKVASQARIQEIARLVVPGVPLSYVADPPSSLPSRTGYLWFLLDRGNELWSGIQGSRTIAVFCPPRIVGASLDLFGLSP